MRTIESTLVLQHASLIIVIIYYKVIYKVLEGKQVSIPSSKIILRKKISIKT